MKELPHNFEAEQALLGAILVNNAAYHNVSDILLGRHFADPLHGKLYDAVSKLIERGQMVTAVTLKTYVESDHDLSAAGGSAYLARMVVASVHALDAATFARLIRDAAMRRQLITLANDALASAYAPQAEDTAAEQVELLERGLYELASDGAEGGFRPFGANLTRAVSAAEAAHSRSGALAGISTGLAEMDRILGGLHRSDLIILAGRPSMGKTALATNIAFAAAHAHRSEPDFEGKPRP